MEHLEDQGGLVLTEQKARRDRSMELIAMTVVVAVMGAEAVRAGLEAIRQK